MKKIISLLLIILILTSCATETFVTIESSEPNTDITLDGMYLGIAPVSVTIGNESWEDHTISAKNENGEETHYAVEKEIKVTNALVGFLLFWPAYLYAWGPKPFQYITMR